MEERTITKRQLVQENVSNWEQLQTMFKEEITLNETVNKHQHTSLDSLHKSFIEYYRCKLKIKDKCDDNNKLIGISSNLDQTFKVELIENTEVELCDIYEPASRLLFKLRNNFDFTLAFISRLKKEEMDEFVNLFCHFFYEDIFSNSPDQDDLLVLCFKLLKVEIDQLNTPSVSSFLDQSFVGRLLKSFTRRQDIKSYLAMVLGDLILKMENMTENFLDLEISRIYEYIKTKKVNDVLNKSFNLEKIKKIFEMDKRSFLVDNLRRTTIFKRDSNSMPDANKSVNAKSIAKDILMKKNTTDILDQSPLRLFNGEDLPSLEDYLLDMEYDDSNLSYQIDLTEEEIKFRCETENDPGMKEFYLRQLLKFDKDQNIYTNEKFLENISVYGAESFKILLIYKQNFEKIKFFIDELFNNLLDNDSTIPYVVKSICKMIDILITQKFPNINFLDRNSFIAEFIFGRLIMPILSNPDFNGIVSSVVISMNTRKNMMIINKIIRKISRANFFESSLETNYTIFNPYLIEIMPMIKQFFKKLTKVSLPKKIEKALSNNNEIEISYDYFTDNPEQVINIQSICFSMSELNSIMKSIRNYPQFYLTDKSFVKAFEKLEINDNFIQAKLKECKTSNVKKYYVMINDVYNPNKVELLYPKQFRFTNTDSSQDPEAMKAILPRIKFCIKTILRNINIINTRVYSHLEKAETTPKLISALSKIIQLEEYSDNFTKDKVPLSWYSLYLEAHLPYLVDEYTDSNYKMLYDELYNEIKHDIDNLNHKSNMILTKIGLKLRCAEKVNELTKKELGKVQQIEKFIRVEKFIENGHVPICVRSRTNEDDNKSIIIAKYENCIHRFHHLDKAIEGKSEKKNLTNQRNVGNSANVEGHCETIIEFIKTFQYFNEIKEDIIFGDQRHKIYESLDCYLGFVQEELVKHPLFTNYLTTEDSKVEILEEIENYIVKKVYKKVFPSIEMDKDKEFFIQCQKLEWIRPEHLEINKKYVNEKLWVNAITFLHKMDEEKSPLDKLKCVQSAYKIVNNSINFCSGKEEYAGVDDIIPILIYIVIKTKPGRIFSNMQYVKSFMNPSKLLATYGFLLTQIEMCTEFILGLNYKMLKISESEYNMFMDDETKRVDMLKNMRRKNI